MRLKSIYSINIIHLALIIIKSYGKFFKVILINEKIIIIYIKNENNILIQD